MLQAIVQPALAFAWKYFLDTLRSAAFLVLSLALFIEIFVDSLVLGFVMAGTPRIGMPGAPNPFEVWFQDGSGALVAITFGVTPILLPLLPIFMGSRFVAMTKEQAISELSLTKPVPPWGPALGTFAGLFGALTIPTVVISLGNALAISLGSGGTVDGGLLAASVGASVLLVGLYLLLTLVVGTIAPPGLLTPIMALFWFAFNITRATGFFITARLATILGAKTAATFQAGWADMATLTGLYQSLLAPAVPRGLGFVTSVGTGEVDPTQVAPWATLVWFGALFVIYTLLLRRIPTR